MTKFEQDLLSALAVGTFLWAVLIGAATIGQLL